MARDGCEHFSFGSFLPFLEAEARPQVLMMSSPSADQFDVVKAAEALLESAREFAAAVEAGNLSKPAEEEMRRKLGGAAQKIASQTLSPVDLTKSEFVAVSGPAAFLPVPTTGR